MKVKKILIIGIWVICINIITIYFQSCCNPEPISFRLESIQTELKRITGIEVGGTLEIGNYLVEPYISDNSGIRYDSLGILVANKLEFAINSQNPFNNFGINSAYACSPAENYDILHDVLITSSEDYNDSYPMGADLSDLMIVSYPFLVKGNNISSFLIGKKISNSVFFTFTYPPSEDKYHKIKIKYILSDSRVYETETLEILIRK